MKLKWGQMRAFTRKFIPTVADSDMGAGNSNRNGRRRDGLLSWPLPGILREIACEFPDADGRRHTVVDKVWMFSEQTLDAGSQYPQDGVIRCAVLAEWRDGSGRDLVRISTATPDQIESTEERTEFVVLRAQVSTVAVPLNLR